MAVQGTGNLVKSLSLLEQAREDVYFSKIDRELIEALHRKAEKAAEQAGHAPDLVAFVDLSDSE
jgi:hypothetical protein